MLLLTGLVCDAASAEPARPNIVVILADDLGFSDLGSFGGEIPTPNLDALAAEGVRFSQFYATPRCCPSRAALLTGLAPHRVGMGAMDSDLGHPSYRGYVSPDVPTVAHVLGRAGYLTALSGKWHVGRDPQHWPRQRGFERFYGIPQGGGVYYELMAGRDLVLDDAIVPQPEDWFCVDDFTDKALGFATDAVRSRRPFLLLVTHIAPHFPLHAREADIARHLPAYGEGWDRVRARRLERQKELGFWPSDFEPAPRDETIPAWSETADQDDQVRRMAIYAAQVEALDRSVGNLMAGLRSLGVADNTLVVFLSDNGAEASSAGKGGKPGARVGSVDSWESYGAGWAHVSNTPFRGAKIGAYEGGITVPCIISWPRGGLARGQIVAEPASIVDLLPTFVALSGAEYPEVFSAQPTVPLAGRSLVPAVRGEPSPQRTLGWEHMGNRAWRDGDWKLVAARGRPWELYHLATDRAEQHNRAASEAARMTALASAYSEWAAENGVQPWPLPQTR